MATLLSLDQAPPVNASPQASLAGVGLSPLQASISLELDSTPNTPPPAYNAHLSSPPQTFGSPPGLASPVVSAPNTAQPPPPNVFLGFSQLQTEAVQDLAIPGPSTANVASPPPAKSTAPTSKPDLMALYDAAPVSSISTPKPVVVASSALSPVAAPNGVASLSGAPKPLAADPFDFVKASLTQELINSANKPTIVAPSPTKPIEVVPPYADEPATPPPSYAVASTSWQQNSQSGIKASTGKSSQPVTVSSLPSHTASASSSTPQTLQDDRLLNQEERRLYHESLQLMNDLMSTVKDMGTRIVRLEQRNDVLQREVDQLKADRAALNRSQPATQQVQQLMGAVAARQLAHSPQTVVSPSAPPRLFDLAELPPASSSPVSQPRVVQQAQPFHSASSSPSTVRQQQPNATTVYATTQPYPYVVHAAPPAYGQGQQQTNRPTQTTNQGNVPVQVIYTTAPNAATNQMTQQPLTYVNLPQGYYIQPNQPPAR